jgi:mannose-1-phosphate guanylyltransferase
LATKPRHGFAPPVVVTAARHIDHVEAQLGRLDDATIVVEPSVRNTAAAIANAAPRLDPGADMLAHPSDLHLPDDEAFQPAARSAAALAADGCLVSLGIEAKTALAISNVARPCRTAASVWLASSRSTTGLAGSFLAARTYA